MNEEDRGAFTAFLKTAIRAGVIFDFNDPDCFRDKKFTLLPLTKITAACYNNAEMLRRGPGSFFKDKI